MLHESARGSFTGGERSHAGHVCARQQESMQAYWPVSDFKASITQQRQ